MKRTASEGSGGVGIIRRSFQRMTSSKPKTLSDLTNSEQPRRFLKGPL